MALRSSAIYRLLNIPADIEEIESRRRPQSMWKALGGHSVGGKLRKVLPMYVLKIFGGILVVYSHSLMLMMLLLLLLLSDDKRVAERWMDGKRSSADGGCDDGGDGRRFLSSRKVLTPPLLLLRWMSSSIHR